MLPRASFDSQLASKVLHRSDDALSTISSERKDQKNILRCVLYNRDRGPFLLADSQTSTRNLSHAYTIRVATQVVGQPPPPRMRERRGENTMPRVTESYWSFAAAGWWRTADKRRTRNKAYLQRPPPGKTYRRRLSPRKALTNGVLVWYLESPDVLYKTRTGNECVGGISNVRVRGATWWRRYEWQVF